jgi:secreted trypsin-like serine protease
LFLRLLYLNLSQLTNSLWNLINILAAHCLHRRGYGYVKFVKLGYIDRNENSVTRTVAKIFPHPDYDKAKMNNDIGLLKLNEAVELNEKLIPICLPSKLDLPEKAVASGFGKTGNCLKYF